MLHLTISTEGTVTGASVTQSIQGTTARPKMRTNSWCHSRSSCSKRTHHARDTLPVDGFYVVRQSYAHAWAEYWQPGVGWVRADPTGAIAPDRVIRSRHLAPAPGLMAQAIGQVDPALLARLRSAWEATNNRWNQWVMNYSRAQQLDLPSSRGSSAGRAAEEPRLLGAELGGPGAAADRHAQHARAGRCRLGLVGPPPCRPLGAPDGRGAPRAARPAPARRGTRAAAHAGGAGAHAARRGRRHAGAAARRAGAPALCPRRRDPTRPRADTSIRHGRPTPAAEPTSVIPL